MMGEYIDRAEALSAISNWLRKAKFPLNASAYNRGEIAAYETSIEEISELPAADVVEVVRCRDCRWWDKIEGSPLGYCHACKHAHFSTNWEISIYRTYKEDFYCADGERKDGDA